MTDNQLSENTGFAARLQKALDAMPPQRQSPAIDGKGRTKLVKPNASIAARAIGVSPQAFQQWLDGQTKPRPATLTKLAEYLRVSPEYLQFGTPSLQPAPPQIWVMVLDSEELAIVNNYRLSTDLGKRHMRAASVGTEKLPTDQLPITPMPFGPESN